MGQLIVICGPAGAGKSTYGKKLASELGACFLDSDTVTEPVVRVGMSFGGEDPNDRDSTRYKERFRDPVYECLFATAAENIGHTDVVLVGPFTSEIQDEGWALALAERFGCEVRVIFLVCSDEERRRRIKERGNPRDQSKLNDWEGYLSASDSRGPAFECEVVRT